MLPRRRRCVTKRMRNGRPALAFVPQSATETDMNGVMLFINAGFATGLALGATILALV